MLILNYYSRSFVFDIKKQFSIPLKKKIDLWSFEHSSFQIIKLELKMKNDARGKLKDCSVTAYISRWSLEAKCLRSCATGGKHDRRDRPKFARGHSFSRGGCWSFNAICSPVGGWFIPDDGRNLSGKSIPNCLLPNITGTIRIILQYTFFFLLYPKECDSQSPKDGIAAVEICARRLYSFGAIIFRADFFLSLSRGYSRIFFSFCDALFKPRRGAAKIKVLALLARFVKKLDFALVRRWRRPTEL